MDAWYSAMNGWQEQINLISKSLNVSVIKDWKDKMAGISQTIDVSGIKKWQEQINGISKLIGESGLSQYQEQISGILHLLDTPLQKWQKEFMGLSRIIEASVVSKWQETFEEISDLHNAIIEQDGLDISDYRIDYDNQVTEDRVCNIEKLSNEEVVELSEDIKEVFDKALNSAVSKSSSNIHNDIYEKYQKWEVKNPIKAGFFKMVIGIIIENLIIFLWSAFSTSVMTVVPLIMHEDSKASSEVVCTVPANSEVEIYPIRIPYYYYIVYTDPLTGDIYDGCVTKRAAKFEKLEAVDEIILPASLY